jgi:hypothetical protein
MAEKSEKTYTLQQCLEAIRNSKDFTDNEVKDIFLNTVVDSSRDISELVDELSFWRKNLIPELSQAALKQKTASF